MQKTSAPTLVGAILGFIGIFTPGLVLTVAVQSFWSVLRMSASFMVLYTANVVNRKQEMDPRHSSRY